MNILDCKINSIIRHVNSGEFYVGTKIGTSVSLYATYNDVIIYDSNYKLDNRLWQVFSFEEFWNEQS